MNVLSYKTALHFYQAASHDPTLQYCYLMNLLQLQECADAAYYRVAETHRMPYLGHFLQ